MKVTDSKGKEFVTYKHSCNYCGKIFYTRSTGDKWCSDECKENHKKSAQESVKRQKWTKEVEKTQSSIRDIVKKASKAGMSYGEYVAKNL